jgi:hypothetical protein
MTSRKCLPAESRIKDQKLEDVIQRTAQAFVHHCLNKIDRAKFPSARAPGIPETLMPRYTEGPRLKSVVILN